MKLNNFNKSSKITLFAIRIPAFLFIAIGALSLLEVIDGYFLLILSAAVVVIPSLFFYLFKIHASQFEFLKHNIKLKYFRILPLFKEYKVINIPLKEFAGYSIPGKDSFKLSYIQLHHQLEGGLAKYEPVSLALFSEEEREQILNQLNRLSGSEK